MWLVYCVSLNLASDSCVYLVSVPQCLTRLISVPVVSNYPSIVFLWLCGVWLCLCIVLWLCCLTLSLYYFYDCGVWLCPFIVSTYDCGIWFCPYIVSTTLLSDPVAILFYDCSVWLYFFSNVVSASVPILHISMSMVSDSFLLLFLWLWLCLVSTTVVPDSVPILFQFITVAVFRLSQMEPAFQNIHHKNRTQGNRFSLRIFIPFPSIIISIIRLQCFLYFMTHLVI